MNLDSQFLSERRDEGLVDPRAGGNWEPKRGRQPAPKLSGSVEEERTWKTGSCRLSVLDQLTWKKEVTKRNWRPLDEKRLRDFQTVGVGQRDDAS
jgi:hypothetical protein